MKALQIGTARAEPGSKARGAIVAGTLPGGAPLQMPLTIINGVESGPVLWLDGCVHGDEPQGTLAIVQLIREIDPEKLRGAVVAVPVMNVAGFAVNQRGDPREPNSYDMSRAYPGKTSGSCTERLAWAHRSEMLAYADIEINLHSGGAEAYLAPYIYVLSTQPGIELAQAMGRGWRLLIRQAYRAGERMSELQDRGKPAISVEIGGGAMPVQLRRDARAMADAIWNVMRHYGMMHGRPEYETCWLTGSQVLITAQSSGVWVTDENFDYLKPVSRGDVLASVYDLYGDRVEQVTAPCNGLTFGVRATAVTRPGDWGVWLAALDGQIDSPVWQTQPG